MSIVNYNVVELVDSPVIKKMRYYGKHLPVPTDTDCRLLVLDHCLQKGVRVIPTPLDVQRNKISWLGFQNETYYPESMFRWVGDEEHPELWGLVFKHFEQMQDWITADLQQKVNLMSDSNRMKNFFNRQASTRAVCSARHPFVYGIAASNAEKISYMTIPKLSSFVLHQALAVDHIHEGNMKEVLLDPALRRSLCMMASPYKLVELDDFAISNHEVELFANILAMDNIAESYYIEIEDDVKHYMHESSYSNEWHEHGGDYTGTLGAGCMRYDRCQPFLDIYEDCEHCKILVMKDQDGGIVARALLWQNVSVHRRVNTINIMDRVYTLRNAYEPLMIQWAKDNGYHYKKLQSYNSAVLINPTTGKEMRGQVRIPIEWPENGYNKLPYIDTYAHIYPELGFMSNSSRVRPIDTASIRRINPRSTDGYYREVRNYA